MQPTRRARLESVLLSELSTLVRNELKDPRIPPVTFTSAKLSLDCSTAVIQVSILGGAQAVHEKGSASFTTLEATKRMRGCLTGLSSASGFLRRYLKKNLHIKNIPALVFREDEGLDELVRLNQLFSQL